MSGQSNISDYYPQGIWHCSEQSDVNSITIIKHFGETIKNTTLEVIFVFRNGKRTYRNYVYAGLKATYYSNFIQNGNKLYSEITCLRGRDIQERLINKSCKTCDVVYYFWNK